MNNYPNILKEAFNDLLEIKLDLKKGLMLLSNNTSYVYNVKDLIPQLPDKPLQKPLLFFDQSLLYRMSKSIPFLNRMFYKNYNLFFGYILILQC
jgi:hypothetical protein